MDDVQEQLAEALRRIAELERQLENLTTDVRVIQRYASEKWG